MKYRPQHELIDPDVVGDEHRPLQHDPENPEGAYLMEAPADAPRPWVVPTALTLAAAALALTVWNTMRFMQGPPVPPVPTPVETKQALYLGVMKLDAYRRMHGVTPETMMDAGLAAGSGYTYTRVDGRHYVLTFEDRTARQIYDSATPLREAFGSPKEMFTLSPKGDTE